MPEASNDRLPDLSQTRPIASIADGGMVAGTVGADRVVVCRVGGGLFAYGAVCPHLGAPLDEGLIAGGTLRCPWHHARFDLATGAATCAPAFDSLSHYPVETHDGAFTVGPRSAATRSAHKSRAGGGPMVIVGGGAAGFAAADALRRGGWDGEIILFSEDRHQPYDRTLLTKDYLDGSFADDRLGIARHDLASLDVRFKPGVRAKRLNVREKTIELDEGGRQPYAKLLLATGAAPRKLPTPGANLAHVFLLRSLDDCLRILARAAQARRVAIIGGSFIALEAAASLRSRGLEVEVIAQEDHPLERVFGRELSDLIVRTHRDKGVALTLGASVARIGETGVTLDDGRTAKADFVVVGAGVEPRLELAAAAGLAIDRGVVVDAAMRTSAPDVYAAGDIARWPEAHSGESIRVEHWVVAERQGQVAAANMLGLNRTFDTAPFFWTKHFDLSVHYVGHAESWDELLVDGDVAKADATIRFSKDDRVRAVATVGRDRASLRAEIDWEAEAGAASRLGRSA